MKIGSQEKTLLEVRLFLLFGMDTHSLVELVDLFFLKEMWNHCHASPSLTMKNSVQLRQLYRGYMAQVSHLAPGRATDLHALNQTLC